ncbi:hypothetical protein HZH68_015210 [Vespula germanica]|uniref:Ig-like domain-containing protein n=1 Tax=Vespula germanica TaxID=30212 RepID=A0A834JAZ3_VESGE|nr:hypothetical protein HZH68_015210 [Vespula germanica]
MDKIKEIYVVVIVVVVEEEEEEKEEEEEEEEEEIVTEEEVIVVVIEEEEEIVIEEEKEEEEIVTEEEVIVVVIEEEKEEEEEKIVIEEEKKRRNNSSNSNSNSSSSSSSSNSNSNSRSSSSSSNSSSSSSSSSSSKRFPHKPYINEDFPKNVTALVNSSVTFKCPIVSDLEPYIQWVKVAEYPGDQEDTPKGTLLQVQPLVIFVRYDTGGETVRHRPILTRPPRNTTVLLGSNASMTCEVLSDAHRHLEWYHGCHTSFDTVNKTNQTVRVEVKVGTQQIY